MTAERENFVFAVIMCYNRIMEVTWNLWHGCHKYSAGCKNCYVYRQDGKHDVDSSKVRKTASFSLPVARGRSGEYKYPSGTCFMTCFTSDFLIEDADDWRGEAWDMIRERSDCDFVFITKRIVRFKECLPFDWGDGWDNVSVGCTVENNLEAERRMPVFLDAPLKSRFVCCEPLLEKVDLTPWLDDRIDMVIAGGESGVDVRECDYDWVLDLRRQCVEAGVSFRFKQTGAIFKKDGRYYSVPRKLQHVQAKKAGIDYFAGKTPF